MFTRCLISELGRGIFDEGYRIGRNVISAISAEHEFQLVLSGVLLINFVLHLVFLAEKIN